MRPVFLQNVEQRMQNYRLSSSALTGRAPRSMRDAFGCNQNDPVHPMPETRGPGLRELAAAAFRVIARLFGR
jgi:hypothetical protein